MHDLENQAFHHAFPFLAGASYCKTHSGTHATDAKAWQTLRHWSRVALRRRDMQEWVVLRWLNRYWVTSYNEVMKHKHGTFKEALVIARMWNSAPQEGLDALAKAEGMSSPSERIETELKTYGKESDTHQGRIPVMRRPIVVYDALLGAP